MKTKMYSILELEKSLSGSKKNVDDERLTNVLLYCVCQRLDYIIELLRKEVTISE